ncbi:MAG: LytR/AlgR family response regulator transcription factor [Symbiobacteriia bacterium]
MVLKALLVDDEPPARMELRYRLAGFPEIEIIGEAANAREARQLIEALDYDVVFLDVEMPGLNGIELAKELREKKPTPRVVFVTAHEHYAVPAFALRATDYLLKPFDEERLGETVQRLLELQGEGPLAAVAPAEPARPPLSWVLAERDERNIPVPLADIIYIFSEGDAVYVQTFPERLLTRYTLQELTDRLPGDLFFRCHRSFLVNVHQIKEIAPYFNGAYILKMKDKNHSEVSVSRSNVRRLKELFSMD